MAENETDETKTGAGTEAPIDPPPAPESGAADEKPADEAEKAE